MAPKKRFRETLGERCTRAAGEFGHAFRRHAEDVMRILAADAKAVELGYDTVDGVVAFKEKVLRMLTTFDFHRCDACVVAMVASLAHLAPPFKWTHDTLGAVRARFEKEAWWDDPRYVEVLSYRGVFAEFAATYAREMRAAVKADKDKDFDPAFLTVDMGERTFDVLKIERVLRLTESLDDMDIVSDTLVFLDDAIPHNRVKRGTKTISLIDVGFYLEQYLLSVRHMMCFDV
jgi:hypothetical protein